MLDQKSNIRGAFLMAKHRPEFKVHVVHESLQGNMEYRPLAKKY